MPSSYNESEGRKRLYKKIVCFIQAPLTSQRVHMLGNDNYYADLRKEEPKKEADLRREAGVKKAKQKLSKNPYSSKILHDLIRKVWNT